MISDLSALAILASSATAAALGLVTYRIIPPPRRLRSRLKPYVLPTIPVVDHEPTGAIRSIFGPIVQEVARVVGELLDRRGSGVTVLRLRQAGWFRGVGESEILGEFRIRQLKTLVIAVLVALTAGHLVGASGQVRVVLVGLAMVIGSTRTKGDLTKAINKRRELMKIEIYTINQLLAMRVRAGSGVIQAVKTTTQRGSGEVISELEDALRLHRSGWAGVDAFRRIAELTPEPFCSRTYRLLATAEERGADLGRALLALAEDVRETRRESIKRTATKRRAAMLVPTIAILAPVLILFVAAPLPYLITSWQ